MRFNRRCVIGLALCAVGLLLDVFRTILAKAIIVMRRADAEPEIVAPHLFRRTPHIGAVIQIRMTTDRAFNP